MPVIYDRDMSRQWLEHSFGGRSMTLTAMLQPLPSELLEADDVSKLVNSPENDTAECIQPVSGSVPFKRQLPLL
jgi:putative SOS response-associated peptidase YedK